MFQSLLILLLSASQLHAQRFLVSNEKENILYVRVENPLSVVVDGVDCEQLIIKTDNGTIDISNANKSACKYVATPAAPGIAKITVYQKTKNKPRKIGEMFFRVKYLPAPEPMVGNIDKDTLNKKQLIAMGGVRAIQVNSDICANFEVLSYRVKLIRNDIAYAQIMNSGARYTPELLTYLYTLKKDD